MKLFLTLVLISLGGPAARAHDLPATAPAAAAYDAYYKVGEVRVTEEAPRPEDLLDSYLPNLETPAPPVPGNAGGDHPAIWDMILNGDWNAIVLVGTKILEIIKAGEPVVNVKRDVVHAIPAGIKDWQLLAGWQVPMAKVFRVSMKNMFGGEMVNVRVKVTGSWGGSAAGRGQYLSNVVIVPTDTYVGWGWNLDLWSESRDPVNAGSFEAPVAGLGFDVRYRAKTKLNEISGAQDYYLSGDGKIQALEAGAPAVRLLSSEDR